MSSHILITGGAGYIGSHTIVAMQETTDWTPVSIDNLSNSELKVYERISSITGEHVIHHEIDLRDRGAIAELFEKYDFAGVMHFAAMKAVGESVEKPLEYYENNVSGLLNLLHVQREYQVPLHIFSSSCTVYGASQELPVTESTPIAKSESPYGQTKIIGEQILEDVAKMSDGPCVLALRYFNPIGAHESGHLGELPRGIPNNLVPYITQTAAGIRKELTIYGNDYPTRDGTCIRDYVHVSDIAEAHVLAMKHLLEGQQAEDFDFINLGTGRGVTVKEAVDTFINANKVDLTHSYGPRRVGDVMEMYADRSKAEQLLKWIPKRDLDESMRSAWKWQCHLQA